MDPVGAPEVCDVHRAVQAEVQGQRGVPPNRALEAYSTAWYVRQGTRVDGGAEPIRVQLDDHHVTGEVSDGSRVALVRDVGHVDRAVQCDVGIPVSYTHLTLPTN